MWILKLSPRLKHRPTFVSKTCPEFNFTMAQNPRYVVCPPSTASFF